MTDKPRFRGTRKLAAMTYRVAEGNQPAPYATWEECAHPYLDFCILAKDPIFRAAVFRNAPVYHTEHNKRKGSLVWKD